jgi:menaquinone-9 beta-reductase
LSFSLDNPDILIAGGGPAGLAAGIVCARHGLRTVVYEKRVYPMDKACGEGIMPSGVAFLEKLGVASFLDPKEIFPFRGISYISPGGQAASADFHEGPGWGVQRRTLSLAMQAAAQRYDDLQIVPGVSIDRLETAGDQVIVRAGESILCPRLVIGADGLNSIVRTALNNTRPTRTHYRWGVRQHFQTTPWNEHVEVYWKGGIEAYVTPVGSQTLNLAFLCDHHILAGHMPKGEIMRCCLERFPALQKRLLGAQPIDPLRAIGPLEQPVRHTTGNGIVLLGDSAGYLDAITGEGISLALGSALLFEQTVVPLLMANPGRQLSVQELKPFSNLQSAQYHHYAHFARLALYFSNHGRFLDAAVQFLSRRPSLFQYLLSCNLGTDRIRPSALPMIFKKTDK